MRTPIRFLATLLALVLASAHPSVAPAAPSSSPDLSSVTAAAKDASLRHYLQGVYAEGEGDLQRALAEFGRAAEFDPMAPDLALKLSGLLLRMGEPRMALAQAQRALGLGDRSGSGHLLAGSALASMGRVAEAKAEFTRSVAEDSTEIDAWLALGRAHEETNDVPGAAHALRRAIALDPERFETAWRLARMEAQIGNYGAADSLLDRIEDAAPGMPGVAVTRGWVAERTGRFAEAADAYRRHLEFVPTDLSVRKQLLGAYARLDDEPRAFEQARILNAQMPDDLDVARVLVSLHLKADRKDEAVAIARRLRGSTPGRIDTGAFAIGVLGATGHTADARREADALAREAPRDYRTHLVAAEVWAEREGGGPVDPAEADRRYDAALRVAPDSVSARVHVAQSMSRTKRFERAGKLLAEALEREPKNPRIWLDRAFALERQKDLAGAEAAARRSLELDAQNPQALNFLGYLFADANIKLDEAAPLIRKALELDPRNPYYLDSLGWAYFRLGRLEDARGELEQAIELSGGDPEIHGHLGDVYLALGRTEDAKLQYQKGLRLDPTSDSLTRKLAELR
jgi:tetratricopeptide (TPR) repeat protein